MARALLRPGLLEGIRVGVAAAGAAGAAPGARPSAAEAAGRIRGAAPPFAAAVAAAAESLGATVSALAVDPFGDPPPDAGVDQLVWDAASAYAAAEGVEAVRAALDGAWLAIRAAAPETARKVVLIAPPPGDAHAAAARAGLENLARTLSIEWARFGVRTVAIHPGAATQPGTVADLCAFLASPAGDYHSGSLIALDGLCAFLASPAGDYHSGSLIALGGGAP